MTTIVERRALGELTLHPFDPRDGYRARAASTADRIDRATAATARVFLINQYGARGWRRFPCRFLRDELRGVIRDGT